MILKTLPEVLFHAAQNYPDHGIGYINISGEVRFQGYPDILQQAGKILTGLQHRKVHPGDKIILSLEKNEEIIPLLWACFLGGIVPTILQPPVSYTEFNPSEERIEKVFDILGKPKVIFSDNLLKKWTRNSIESKYLLGFSSLLEHDLSDPVLYEGSTDDLVFIQFSSGSTGEPKGIMLTHRNILINIDDICHGIDLIPEDRSINWMPLYHDLGLVGFHLTATYRSVYQFHIDPADFIKKPFLWLDMITRERITVTASPNFGQALILRYLTRKEKGTWDLSSLKTLLNGAEPISVPVMNEFIKQLAPYGFPGHAMMPVYGMAEATLAITFSPLYEPASVISFDRGELEKNNRAVECIHHSKSVRMLANVGKPLKHVEVRIVDDHDREIEDQQVGNIQFTGPNGTNGYYNNAGATGDLFNGKWYRTGDLGFFYKGNLFITGRSKDIIFINGKNYYSLDLENISLQITGVIFGKIVIAGYFEEQVGHDELVVFIVGANDLKTQEVCKSIKKLFINKLAVNIRSFIPLRSNEIPRTTSGKIQRYKLIDRFIKGKFETVLTI